MPLPRLRHFLDVAGVGYEPIAHPRTLTAQETAAAAHVPGHTLAKTVMVHLDGKLTMAVLTADAMIDFDLLRDSTGSTHVELADEVSFAHAFPDCEVGAQPPFGNLYQLPVLVDRELTRDRYIAFNEGCHTTLLRMLYADYERLVHPRIVTMTHSAIV